MKYNELMKQEESRENENIFMRFLKALPRLVFKIFKGIKMVVKFLSWLLDQFAEFVITIEDLLFAKKTKKYNKEIRQIKKDSYRKTKLKIGLGILILLFGIFLWMHHKNSLLQDMVDNMQVTDGKSIEDVKEAENKIKEASKLDVFGTDSIKTKIGSVDPGYYGKSKGYIRYKSSDGTAKVELTDTYGIGEFTASPKGGTRYVKNVTDYIKSVEPELYKKYFSKVNAPGTTTFTTGWQDFAIDEKETFTKLQFQYIYINYVSPVMDELVKEYSIDKKNDAMKEFIFSTSMEYGYKGSLTLFKNAGVKKGEDTKTIIEKVQNEKISAVGNYTFTDEYKYDDYDRKTIKSEIETETKLFLNRL